MKKIRVIQLILSIGLIPLIFSGHADAGNAACWGDDSRQDISCRALTESFLLGMRGVSRGEVIKQMGANGRVTDAGLHFISNYSKGIREGSGIVNFSFDETGRVSVIYADVDHAYKEGIQQKSMEFIWNASKSWLPYCSDFAGSHRRCDD